MESKYSLDQMLGKVQALLARADHPNTPVPEAESCRHKAELLMFKYRIDEAMLASGDAGTALSLSPQWGSWRVCSAQSEFVQQYRTICSAVFRHLGIRGVFKNVVVDVLNEDGTATGQRESVWVTSACGYESDLRIAEVLYTSAMLAFQQRLEPKYDPSLSQQVNAYNMRSAGMEGWRIAQAIFGRDDKALRPKVRAMFRNEAVARGEDPSILLGKGNNVKQYRKDFADGFATEIYYRLQQMRASRGDESTGLILLSRETDINEAFYEKYPQYRPANNSNLPYVSPNKGCPKCEKAKSGYCRDHGYLRPLKGKAQAFNAAAFDRGSRAARTVDIGASPKGHRVEHTEHKEIG